MVSAEIKPLRVEGTDAAGAVAAEVAKAWVATGFHKPLVLSRSKDSIIATLGYPKGALFGSEFAAAIGISYRTFKSRYIDSGILKADEGSVKFSRNLVARFLEWRDRGNRLTQFIQ